jgi:hypothetical protein
MRLTADCCEVAMHAGQLDVSVPQVRALVARQFPLQPMAANALVANRIR